MQLLIGAVVIYAGVCVVARLAFRRVLYPAPPPRAFVAEGEPRVELLALRTADGVAAHVAFVAPPPGARTVVFFHGNGEQIADSVPLARDLARRGFGVALVEYRGYGPSAGPTPTEAGLYLDAEAALDALASRGIQAAGVTLWGTSLGSGVAAEMARRGRGASLVLVTPYTSIPGIASRFAPFLPTRLCVADHFDTLAKAGEIKLPTLIIHGDRDEVIPYDMGELLARTIAGARFITVPGGHHNDLFNRDGVHLMTEIDAHARR